jgi:hypothetical protein
MSEPVPDWGDVLETRHIATQEKMLWFEYGHLPEGLPRQTSVRFATLAIDLIQSLQDGPQLTIALDKLRESKDRAVSQAIVDAKKAQGNGNS